MANEELENPLEEDEQDISSYLENKQHEKSALLKILHFMKNKTVDTTSLEDNQPSQ